jgi:glyoxylase-like metal-dependent hydrolase (beta-lactamase superfamily II)
VEHGDRALLIDTGFGPQTLPAAEGGPVGGIHGGTLLESLATLGHTPRSIEAVAFTHLHTDHLGWAWHPAPGSDRPAFAHAEYLVSEPEWAQRESQAEQGMAEEIAAMTPHVRTVKDGQGG